MIPSLPFEITQDIIQLSLPRLRRANARDRYQSLLEYSLVDSLWRSIAQEELVKHLDLRNKQPLEKLIKELERRTAAGLSPKVVSLRIDVGSIDSNLTISVDVQQLFSKCKDAEVIWIKGSNLFGLLAILNPNSYTKLKALNLEANNYISVELPDPAFDLHFPALTHLTLSRVRSREVLWSNSNLFKHSILPRLSSLVLIDAFVGTSPRTTLSSSFAGQIKRLAVYNDDERGCRVNISQMHALEILVITEVSQLRSLTSIPSTLSSIRICEARRNPVEYQKEVLDLQVWITSVDPYYQLQEIYFPLPGEENIDNSKIKRKLKKSGKVLSDFLEARGIIFRRVVGNLMGYSKDEFLETLLRY